MYKVKERYWLKTFDEESFGKIKRSFEYLIPSLNIYEGKIEEFINGVNHFPHLETDFRDDTMGISSKTIHSFLKYNSLESLEKALVVLSYIVNKNKAHFLDEDNHVDWNKLFKKNFVKGLKKYEDAVKIMVDEEFHSYVIDNPYFLYLDSVKLFEMTDKGNRILALQKKKDSLWKNEVNFIPKINLLSLFVMPYNFDYNLSVRYSDILKISKTIHDEFKFVQFCRSPVYRDVFNYNESFYSEETLTKDELYFLKGLPESVTKILDPKVILDIFPKSKYLKELLVDIKKVSRSNSLETVMNIVTFYKNLKFTNDVNLFGVELSIRTKLELSKTYREQIPLVQLESLWKSRFKGEKIESSLRHGKYEISTYKPDDDEQLILGEVTDCCQTIIGDGRTCLISGMEKEKEGFVSVKKRNKIYAQSWYWISDDGKTLCFDSIECPPGANISEIVNLYQLFSEKLIKEYGFEEILTGRDGNRVPPQIYKLESLNKTIKDYVVEASGYSDTYECGMSILKEKDLYVRGF